MCRPIALIWVSIYQSLVELAAKLGPSAKEEREDGEQAAEEARVPKLGDPDYVPAKKEGTVGTAAGAMRALKADARPDRETEYWRWRQHPEGKAWALKQRKQLQRDCEYCSSSPAASLLAHSVYLSRSLFVVVSLIISMFGGCMYIRYRPDCSMLLDGKLDPAPDPLRASSSTMTASQVRLLYPRGEALV